jgi:hypothetical protein
VSRPRRAGHPLLGNIRDMSRNCQRDVSRNYQLGKLPACPVVQARRAATSTSFSPCCDDDHDAVGGRPRPEWWPPSDGQGRCVTPYAQSAPGAYAPTRTSRTSFHRQARALQGRRDCEPGPAAPVLAAGASVPVPGAAVTSGRRTDAAWAGPCQSSAGCQSTGGGSEPCLMMLAYTLSSASLSGPTRPSGSSSKNRRRTSSTCPGAASC